MLNEKKIAFISCVSNQEMYDECIFYINNLSVPEGFSVETYGISDAKSMTSGYQYAMEMSDAKYKVYLHQDVFIINKNFIYDLLNIFNESEKIGLVGMIGTDNLLENGLPVSQWNVGGIYHNCTPSLLLFESPKSSKYIEVEACDGLILCTQTDVNWREDLFDGWDFYDISQCMEIRRKGFICVTPTISTPWVYHDNTYSKMLNYYKYRDIFVDEYQDIKAFKHISPSDNKLAFDQLKEDSRKQIISLINQGNKKDLIDIFSNPDFRGYLHLKELEIIACIAKYQEKIKKEPFWTNDSCDELILKLQKIKYAIRRQQLGLDNNLQTISSTYGDEIILIVKNFYF